MLDNDILAAEMAKEAIKAQLAPDEQEFKYKVKRDAARISNQLQDLTTEAYNSVLNQTEEGAAISGKLLGCLRELEAYRESL